MATPTSTARTMLKSQRGSSRTSLSTRTGSAALRAPALTSRSGKFGRGPPADATAISASPGKSGCWAKDMPSSSPGKKRMRAHSLRNDGARLVLFAISDPWIKHSVTDVYKQVDSHIGERCKQDNPLNHGIVLGEDALDGERADARPEKDRLDHERARQNGADLQADDCEQRHKGVAQGMAVVDLPGSQTLCPCRTNVILVEHFEHTGAHLAQIDSHSARAKRDGGQHE